jgi:hypothetical protein
MSRQLKYSDMSVKSKIARLQCKVISELNSSGKIREIVDVSDTVDDAYTPVLLQLLQEKHEADQADRITLREDVGGLATQLFDAQRKIGKLETKVGSLTHKHPRTSTQLPNSPLKR